MSDLPISAFVASGARHPDISESWGSLTWLVGERQMPGAEQTFGVVTILPGQRNPLHSHPNCEELLFVIEGECEHRLGDATVNLQAGSVIRIPRGIPHWARCTSEGPLRAVISFSAPDRKTISHEGGEA